MTEVPRKPDATQLALDSVMTFGEFKGKTVRDVANMRPSYLVWAIKNVSWFELDATARKYGQKQLNRIAQNKTERMNAWAWGCFSKADYGDEMADHEWQH